MNPVNLLVNLTFLGFQAKCINKQRIIQKMSSEKPDMVTAINLGRGVYPNGRVKVPTR